MMRMLRRQNKFPREAVDVLSLKMFKARLNGDLINMGGIPAHGRNLELDGLQHAVQPKTFHDSVILYLYSAHHSDT